MSVVTNPYTKTPLLNGRKDLALADALTRLVHQHLTELGFASRSRQGWDITGEGSAHLARLDAGGWRDDPIV